MPALRQALAVASSPSECARHCIAVGATPRGMAFLKPKIMEDVSKFEMSLNTRGLMRYLVYA